VTLGSRPPTNILELDELEDLKKAYPSASSDCILRGDLLLGFEFNIFYYFVLGGFKNDQLVFWRNHFIFGREKEV